ncbi:MAG: TIGR02391 family protein [Ignavibacteria bacterium]
MLDKKLIKKIENKGLKNVNVRVSQKASTLGISPEAALILIAKGYNIGTAAYQRKLSPEKQQQVRDNLVSLIKEVNPSSKKVIKGSKTNSTPKASKNVVIKTAIDYLLQDLELKQRCGDLILAKAKFDRAINQATLVLEDRVRTKAQPPNRMTGVPLVNFAFNGDINRTLLKVSDNPDEQEGYTNLIKGMIQAYRNLTHHHVIDTFTKEDALRVCSMIDVLLRVVDNSQKMR